MSRCKRIIYVSFTYSATNSKQSTDGSVDIVQEATLPVLWSIEGECESRDVTTMAELFDGCTLHAGEMSFCNSHELDVIIECEGNGSYNFENVLT